MKLESCFRAEKVRSLCVYSFALIMWYSASLLFAAELPAATEDSSQNSELYEQTRKLALEGSAASQFELGRLFEYGRGVEQNDTRAAYWYEKSATRGHAESQYRLAVLLDNGWGLPVNNKKAFKLYESAAERGHTLAQHDLAFMYFHGTGADKNLVQAYKWLKIANLSGNPLMQKHLQLVVQEMTSDEISHAEYLARHWIETPSI